VKQKKPTFLRWLRSRPLARVRRNLATQRRIRERFRRENAEIRAYYERHRNEPWGKSR
jgi:hypothetical protein